MAYFVLGIGFAARLTEAYLDRRFLHREVRRPERPGLVPVGPDESANPRPVTPGRTP